MGKVAVNPPEYEHPVDYNVIAVKNGWLPFYPQFNINPIRLYDEATKAGGARSDEEVIKYVKEGLTRGGNIRFAVEDPDAPENFPRVLFMWRLTSSPRVVRVMNTYSSTY